MQGMTIGEAVGLALAAVLAVAGAIVTIGNAAEKLLKVWRAAKAPNDEQDKRITDLEKRMDGVDKKLANDQKHLEAVDASNRVTQVALLALLDHGIDGNNIDQMQHAKEELQNHLINR